MGRLIDDALPSKNPDLLRGPCDSHEIDRHFDQALGVFTRREEQKRKKREVRKSPEPLPGKTYYLHGSLFTEDMRVPLEETIRVETLEQAKNTLKEKAKEYHNVEGYAISLNLFDTPNYPRTPLDSVHIKAKS
jgi:hypothetical protein